MKIKGAMVLRDVGRHSDDLLEEIELIYLHRYPAFLRVAVGITSDEELAADAVQDAFVGVVRSRRSLRRRAALEAYVWRSVVNAARDRRALNMKEAPDEAAAPNPIDVDERV